MGASTGSTGVGEMVGLQAPAQPAGGHGQRGGHTRAGDGGGGGDGVGDAREIFLCLNFLRSMVAPTLEGDQRRGEGAVLGVSQKKETAGLGQHRYRVIKGSCRGMQNDASQHVGVFTSQVQLHHRPKHKH